MPPNLPIPGSPEDWLRHARSDLALAQQRHDPAILLITLCFHIQQAAEKSLKAVLVQQGAAFPYTHDLARLISLVQNAGLTGPEDLNAVAALTEYAVGSRYPGLGGEITDEEYLHKPSRWLNTSWIGLNIWSTGRCSSGLRDQAQMVLFVAHGTNLLAYALIRCTAVCNSA